MAGISRLLNRGSRGGSRVVNTTAVSRPSTRTGNDDLHSALSEAISAVIMHVLHQGDLDDRESDTNTDESSRLADIVSDISSDEEEYVNRYLTMPLNVFFGKGRGHIAQYSTIMY